MSDNVYETPKSELATESEEGVQLASRWSRLGAAIIDNIIIMAAVLPVVFFVFGLERFAQEGGPGLNVTLTLFVLVITVFTLVNGVLLVKHGQTWGKKALGIKIVDMSDEPATTKKHFIKRYGAYFLSNHIPVIGQLTGLINILFIFGKQKRCIHDYIGGTKVVKA